jgi:hypothetical protein
MLKRKIVCFSAANNESRKNYENTVLKSIATDKLISEFNISNIPDSAKLASVWGVRWEKIWKDIETNDIALFYANRKFISYGTIMGKKISKELAEYLWNSDEYKNLVIISPVVKINSSREKFWKAFNYAPGLYIQGARIPYIKKQKEIISEFGSLQLFLEDVLCLNEVHLSTFKNRE